MTEQKAPIQPPPLDNDISLKTEGDSYRISGESKGIPISLFSPEELETVEKALRLKEKLSGSSSGDDIESLLARQDFDWSIEVSGGHVTLSTGAPKSDDHFHRRELKRIYRSAEGDHVAELACPGEDESRTQILTGALEPGDDDWLQSALIQIFDLDPNGVSNSESPNNFDFDPPENFRVVQRAGGSRTQIDYGVGLTARIAPLIIGGIIVTVIGASLMSGTSEGVIPDLIKAAGDHPLWSEVMKYVVIAIFTFLILRIAFMVLGTLRMKVDTQSFEIKKGILGLGTRASMPRAKMKSLEQLQWTHILDRSDAISHRVKYWRLVLHSDKSITLLNDETNPRNVEWLAHFLSAKYDLPIEKRTLPTRG
ncbi:MAG: hypothetical protein P1U85_06290 [Verrucomicrobiales bacterium]|nr:hypothetical protein [Verrucomicrobiales bacterium]